MMIAIIILLAFVIFFTLAALFTNEKENSDVCCVCAMIFAIAGLILATIIINNDRPTINDVPDKAHVDTVVTIHGNDTVYDYRIMWNDNK